MRRASDRQLENNYDVPLTTLKRRVNGLNAPTGPPTVLTTEEEKLSEYCLTMCNMGYGLTVEDIRRVAYVIASNSGRSHPFKKGKAGQDWYENFLR